MPGTVACFQCQADLAAAVAPSTEEFYPGRGARRGIAAGLERRLLSARAAALFGPFDLAPGLSLDLLRAVASVIPGLGQRRNGQSAKARAFAAAAVVLVVLEIVLLRNAISVALPWLFGGLVASSMLDAALVSLAQRTRASPVEEPRLAGGLALVVVSLFLAGCLGLDLLRDTFFLQVVVPADMAGLASGEEILARRVSSPRLARGELVVAQRGGGNQADLDLRRRDRVDGDSMEIVVGLPGEEVVVEGGVLRVGGREATDPRVGGPQMPDLRLTVSEGSYACLQYRLVSLGGHRGVETRLVETPAASVTGRPIAVIAPPARRRLFRGAP